MRLRSVLKKNLAAAWRGSDLGVTVRIKNIQRS